MDKKEYLKDSMFLYWDWNISWSKSIVTLGSVMWCTKNHVYTAEKLLNYHSTMETVTMTDRKRRV